MSFKKKSSRKRMRTNKSGAIPIKPGGSRI